MNPTVLVAIVDDDESIRESLPELVIELGFAARTFASAEEFLESGCATLAGCLIVDVSMPGMTGPELEQELVRRGQLLPIVFITAHADAIPHTSLPGRAHSCLLKPFSDVALLQALNTALKRE